MKLKHSNDTEVIYVCACVLYLIKVNTLFKFWQIIYSIFSSDNTKEVKLSYNVKLSVQVEEKISLKFRYPSK